ncbi:SDR family NAD(P)-dependent oxidoreductase [Streptomyces piniterrae]|uniref:SDR family NAD(P)-dependent oxidoreductase n=1 Tax=Streptomyces piniterrae TaxID=2571125 RepID=A0A4U0NVZ6_9ACTN|nr:type I polyketide synthase [Streptomyces piniterrae]TJZ58917.1 SDR family NAD(P)-dependent oxidoreductase [Streptomyces piniterrae]
MSAPAEISDRSPSPDTHVDAVAIVGAGLRLPGGIDSLEALWQALDEGRDLVGEVPADRFEADRFTDPVPGRRAKSYTSAGGFLKDVTGFDAGFFGISPREAARLDPQHRLLLECAVEALDDAAIAPATVAGGDAAVVMGISAHDYADLQHRRAVEPNPYSVSGIAGCNAANRVSYHFDLHGASMAVDTACASALTAVHQACEELRSGRSGLALAGGVNVLISPAGFVGFSHASMLSPTGRCRPFSADADGFVRAEGAGVVVLKPLSAALADGDRVHAVIRSSGANTDGRTQGLALPNARAQAALLERVYAQAGIDMTQVAYVEAHGTGTQAGDPVECESLGRTLGRGRSGAALPVGSVKSNLGHLEAASGIAGLMKALLVLRHQWIPTSLHTQPPNAAIDFSGLGIEPVATARRLGGEGRGLVGVNGFGFGGANAHVVLAAPPSQEPAARAGETAAPAGREAAELDHTTPDVRVPVLVSARTGEAVAAAASRLAEHMEDTQVGLYDVAFTTCERRGRYEHRAAVLAADVTEAAAGLRALAAGDPTPAGATGEAVAGGRIGFVFAGNGPQWLGMGQEMLAHDEAFRAEITAIDGELRARLGWSVLDEMAQPGDAEQWQRAETAQPLLFALQAGVVAALAERGVSPSAVAGHSVGEISAAYCAGVLDRATACQVIAERSRAQGRTAGSGRMAAVNMSREDTELLLADPAYADQLVVAGINSDRDVTLAGDPEALAAVGRVMDERGVFFRDLGLDYAFHSPAMDPVGPLLKDALMGIAPSTGRIPVVSSVTGERLDGTRADADYWWRNIREPVRFADAAHALVDTEGCDVLVEIAPHPALGTYLRRTAAAHRQSIAVVPTLSRTCAGPAALDSALAQLIAVGADLDLSRYFPRRGTVVDLPAYPWQHERHWTGDPSWWHQDATDDAPGTAEEHPLLGARQPSAQPSWHQPLDAVRLPWLKDHLVGTSVVVPAAAYVDMAVAAAQATHEQDAVEIAGLNIHRALTLPLDDPAIEVRLHAGLAHDGLFSVSSRSGRGADWGEHARCRVRRLFADPPPALDVAGLRKRLAGPMPAEEHYALCARAGLPYGPDFQVLQALHTGSTEVVADYAAVADTRGHAAHPTLVDGALQAVLPLLVTQVTEPVPFLPTGIDDIRCWRPLPDTGVVYARTRSVADREAVFDVTLATTDGQVVLELTGCRLRRFDTAPPAHQGPLTEVLRAAPLPTTPHRPAPLPAPGEVVAACATGIGRLSAQWQDVPYAAYRDLVTEMSAHYTADAVREILPGREVFSVVDLLEGGVDPKHRRFLGTLLASAQKHGVLTAVHEGQWRIPAASAAQEIFQRLLHELPAFGPVTHVYAVCGRHLPAVLQGRQDPLELLFSDADGLAARFYDHWPAAQHLNRTGAEVLRALVAGWPKDRPLRVLEVGAGTGGITAHLLPHLPPERTHYTYTDISAAFFPKAQSRFAAFDALTYRCLDLEADPAAQGFADAAFDLVIASNVLHATGDLDRTMRRIAGLLADGGHLLALESHGDDLVTQIFGMLDSYWTATDHQLRPHSPLLSRDAWPPLLGACGFAETVLVESMTGPVRDDFSVLLASRAPRPHPATMPPQAVPAAEDGRQWLLTATAQADDEPRALKDAARELSHEDVPGAVPPEQVHCATAGDDVEQWAGLLAQRSGPVDIVLLTGDPDTDCPEQVTTTAVRHCAVLRAVATACAQAEDRVQATLWLVTPATPDSADGLPILPAASATAWGAARSLANEQPTLAVRRIALVSAGGDPGAPNRRLLREQLLHELVARPEDDEVFLTPRGRFVPRLRPVGDLVPAQHPAGDAPAAYALELHDVGLRYRMNWTAVDVPVPAAGQVLVEVRAVGLNYRDIMIATGLVPADFSSLAPGRASVGLECAGTVAAVGPGVTGVTVGDRVAGPVIGSLGSHGLSHAELLVPLPDDMSFADAATVSVAFLTALYGLSHLARLAPGETVLVHGAAGGVGLAALQHARQVGAKVIASAGTPAKRELLQLLGADHVLDSRSLHFGDEVKQLTDGAGVDVVLNSLAGEAMVRSLELLKPQGRFLELGKRDFLADNSLPLSPFLRDIAFFGVDITKLLTQNSPLVHTLLETLRDRLESGALRPLPHLTFPASRVAEAFGCLHHSRHIGKVVVTFDAPVAVAPEERTPAPDPEAVYLITGGLGGFGAATALHLASRGARHLALVGRRGADAPEAAQVTAQLQAQGCQVRAYAADAADPVAMRGVLDDIDASGRRLGGIVHAAMVLEDGLLTELSDERIRAVLRPKLTGGHVLDGLARDRDLDFFTVYSSASALTGNAGQGAYAGANMALEALVRRRRAAGLPAQAVQWGVISDAGYVRREGLLTGLQALGSTGCTAEESLTAWDRLPVHRGMEVLALSPGDFGLLNATLPALSAPRTAALLPVQERSADAETLGQELASATPEEAVALIENALAEVLADVLQTTADRIDPHRPWDQLGMDSLMNAELTAILHRRFGWDVPPVEIAGMTHLTALAERIQRTLS